MFSNRISLAVALIVLGSLLAAWVQTDGGRITVHDIRFVGAAGNGMSGHLYVPPNASVDTPAPGILAVHGYINSRETQSGFAIEFARRGFVVLALDQSGHGYSDPPAFGYGFGGPDGLAYLRSLPFVDKERIGLEGHSMGGWTVQVAAAMNPDAYLAMVLEGSSTGTFGAPDGTPESPRNLLLVFSLYDEFSELMWGADVPADVVDTPKLQHLFGTDETVVVGERYGDAAAGTARELQMPPVTHPGDHLSTVAIGHAVAWMTEMLGSVEGAPTTDGQVWYWKEFGTLVALVGFAILVFPLVDLVLQLPWFRGVVTAPAATPQMTARRHWVNVLVMALVPVLLFFPLQFASNLILPANPVLPQQITNGVLLWAWGVGIVSLVPFLIWLKRSGQTLAAIGLPLSRGVVARAVLSALLVCSCLYVVVLAADYFLNVDFRFWVVALKHMSRVQWLMYLIYLPCFAVFFVVLSLSLHTQLLQAESLASRMWKNGLTLSMGFAALLLVQYLPLLAGGTLAIPSQPLLTIVAFQFVPLLFLVALVSTFCFARTNNVLTGTFANAILITWYMVAGTATQAVPFWF